MINILLAVLGVIGIAILYSTRKIEEKSKSKIVVMAQYTTMILIVIVILSAYSQFDSAKKEKEYKKAAYEVDVLSKVSEHLLPVMTEMQNIQNGMLSIKYYLSYEKAKKENANLGHLLNWEAEASESRVLELNLAKESFKKIQLVAAKIKYGTRKHNT